MRIVFAIAVLALVRQAAPQTSTGAIEGFVLRYGTLEPIPDVQVVATQSSIANASGTTTTDQRGHFTLNNVGSGQYAVVARREGYFGTGANRGPGATVAVTVEGQRRANLTLFLVPGGTIAGRIRGQAISGAQAEAVELVYDRFGRSVLRSVQSVIADGNGDYRLTALAPGEYYIRAREQVGRPVRGGFAAAPPLLPPTYFPNTLDILTSPTVYLKAGSEMVAMDITMQSAPTRFSVSGTIINAVPESLTAGGFATTVYAIPHDASIIETTNVAEYPNATADASSGRFEIRNLLPGSYDLYAGLRVGARTGFTRPSTFVGHQLIDVRNQNLENLTLTVRPGTEMRGRITVNGEAPRGRVGQAQVGWVPADGLPSSLLTFGDGASSLALVDRETGEFILKNVPPGRYRFNYGTTVPADTYVLDARIGGKSVWDEDITIGETSPGFLDVIVEVPGGIVEGVVTDDRQMAVGGAAVALVPQQRRQTAALYRFVTADHEGRFTVRAVAPGEYKVFAGTFNQNMWMNPRFLASQEAKGTAVTVKVGSPASVRLRIIPE
jgi:hypothetical protein